MEPTRETRQLTASSTARERSRQLEPGTQVGRYVLLGMVGRGGMGTVYEAYDPQLDRKVCVKLLRHAGEGEEREAGQIRLLREAQAMARLDHPNVVAVHDAGRYEDEVFLAMDLVEGQDLEQWLANRHRSLPEIVEIFLQAGRGLAAAHEAGLVHRDFKPGNVLVNKRGRARVADFGVARWSGLTDSDTRDNTAPTPTTPLDSDITRAGAMVGTPRFMAPEQWKGSASARSDQYAFCLALCDALYGRGQRKRRRPSAEVATVPYGRSERSPAAEQQERGRARQVPRHLGRVLERGLHQDPARRYPNMNALLAALTRALHRRKRIAIWAAAAGLVALVGLLAVMGTSRSGAPPRCNQGQAQLAGIWDGPRRAQGRAAFAATGVPYAAEAWERTSHQLDGYAMEWSALWEDACVATHVQHVQSPDVLDRRMLCLSQRREDLQALADVLLAATPKVVERAARAAHELEPLSACSDMAVLLQRQSPPTDVKGRVRLEHIHTTLAESKALYVAGKVKDSIARATRAANEASALDYRPMEAEAYLWLGKVTRRPAPDEAEEFLHQALRAAEVGRDDVTKISAWLNLVFVAGYRLGRPGEGERWASYATDLLEAMGGHPRLQVELLRMRGMLAALQGEHAEAQSDYDTALGIAEGAFGPDSFEAGEVHSYWAVSLGEEGDYEKAALHHRREIEIFEETRGPNHPRLAMPLTNYASTLCDMGKYQESEAVVRRALGIWERSFGPDAGYVAYGRLALICQHTGRKECAESYAQRAIAAIGRDANPDRMDMVVPLVVLIDLRLADRRLDDAEALANQLLQLFETIEGPEGSGQLEPLTYLAEVELARGRSASARRLLERAVSFDDDKLAPELRSRAMFGLARALRACGRETNRVFELLATARQLAREAGPLGTELLANMAAWQRPRR